GSIAFNNVWNNNVGNYGFYNNQTGQFNVGGQYDETGNYGNISEDPLFVDADEHDYHFQTGSPCINAGDPASVVLRDQTDFDGESRIHGETIDIGAYEYRGYVSPVADAGPDQHVDMPQDGSPVVILDGSGSFFYDPCGVMEYSWEQVGGAAGVINDFTSVHPTFIPESEGEYRFELIVSDGLNISEPDEVIIVVSNLPPIADAGPDQSLSSIPQIITLDGSDSYDRSGDSVNYHWSQTSGPAIALSDSNSVTPTFAPPELGIYVFELVVDDGELDSEPDEVGIVIGNHAPVADAGLPRYAAVDPVVLDGSGSFDSDGYGELSYQWRQTAGPTVTITGQDTTMPTISGFTQTNEIQRCEFALTISDGDMDSQPDTVEVVIVPDFGSDSFLEANPPFDPDKPTMVAFGGGDCEVGSGMAFSETDDWFDQVNFLTLPSYEPPYDKYADELIVYLSSIAPGYIQPIQTVGFDTGGMPAIDIANRMNEVYADARYAVNRVSLLDATCRDYSDDIARFNASRVGEEPCWIDNYYTAEGNYYPGTLNILFPAPNANHTTPVIWYMQSFNPGGGARRRPLYNGGLVAGFYISVAGANKNLQLVTDGDNYYFEWSSQTNVLRFHDASLYTGRIPEEVRLLGPEDGATVSNEGAVLSCQESDAAVSYRLLFGPAPDQLDYLVSDTPEPPAEVITEFPFETTYWTVMAADEFGSTVYADPRRIIAAEEE
ncbi:MAG: choice-of-anchor Q domain-containing protein, partial [Phycisphaerales bacterium]